MFCQEPLHSIWKVNKCMYLHLYITKNNAYNNLLMWWRKQGDDDLNEVTMKQDSTLYNWVRVAFNHPLRGSGVGGN